jgi:uncharacterized membrane protein
MNWTEFFYENFIKGWSSPESYNLFDTSAYAILAIIMSWAIYKILKGRIKFDLKLLLKILPFIVLGSIIRVFADTGFYERFFWTVTPGVWLMMVGLFLLTFFLDTLLVKKKILTYFIPITLILFHLPHFKIVNFSALPLYLLFFSISFAIIMFLSKKLPFLRDKLSIAVMLSHFFDATSTFINIDFYNYIEVHVVGSFFTELLGTGSIMYLLKAAVLLPLLYCMKKDKDQEFNDYLKIIICVLGLGPGIRNFITLLLGV